MTVAIAWIVAAAAALLAAAFGFDAYGQRKQKNRALEAGAAVARGQLKQRRRIIELESRVDELKRYQEGLRGIAQDARSADLVDRVSGYIRGGADTDR